MNLSDSGLLLQGARSRQEVLSFELAGDAYGIDIGQVQEIRSYAVPTRLANAEAWFLGVTNLRGEIIPVIDLRTRLGLPAPIDERTVTAVLRLHGRSVGVVVDAVRDVIDLVPGCLQPPPAAGHVDTTHIHGLAELPADGGPSQLLTLLDVGHLLRDLIRRTDNGLAH